MFKNFWKFTLPLSLLMLAALGTGSYVVLHINDFSYETTLKVPGWLEFKTQFIRGLEPKKSLQFPSLVLSQPPTSPPVPTTAWEYNGFSWSGDRPPSIPHSDTNTVCTPSH
jgi:hypothetical protein